MKGERNRPVSTLIPSENQLEPTFFRICSLSNLRILRTDRYHDLLKFAAENSQFSPSIQRFYRKKLKVVRKTQPLLDQRSALGERDARPIVQDSFCLLDAEEYASSLSRQRDLIWYEPAVLRWPERLGQNPDARANLLLPSLGQ